MTNRNHRGVALLVVILAICAVVPVVIDLQRAVRGVSYEALNAADRIVLQQMASSGFNLGQAMLMSLDEKPYISLTDQWARMNEMIERQEGLFPEGRLKVSIEDELGKIPLNMLVAGNRIDGNIRELIVRLLRLPEFALSPEQAEEMVAAIIDWIDADEELTPGGAESAFYRSHGYLYEAKNAPLDDIYELLMVKGVTKELFFGNSNRPGLKDLFSLHGTGRINVNTAPPIILRTLSPEITVEMASEMDAYRRNETNDLSDIMWYKKVKGMAEISIKRDIITVKSNIFRIQSEAARERMRFRVMGIVERLGGGRPRLLAYRWDR